MFALAGLIYGLALALWGALVSGGGHLNLPIMLFISAVWFGLLLWPLWGFLSVRFNSIVSKTLFLLTMFAHFVGLFLYIVDADNSDGYWFRIGMNDRASYCFLPQPSRFI
jgi:predicted PurR-regulated permease PerM